ncbi:MAG: RagB/SusD family nutrient uptake outer membrane protein [Prevotellaceae bacterium]|jgi:hypothetical protein|nr:RagB/SusD family nutrient uptake outer membrane protein [Prevotellaceae bacterium]
MKTYLFIIKTLALAIVINFTSSCEEMIKEKTFDFIQPQDIPDSDAGATQWVMGTYSKLLDDMFRWNVFPTVLEFDCDYISGPDWAFRELGAGNFQSFNDMNYMWDKPYSLIHRANYAIENINAMKNVSQRYKNNIIGELKFLKAYAYFLLVRAYGPIPLRHTSINATGETNIPRSAITDVYAHIIDLLKEAEQLMYKNTDSEFEPGRASAGAAAILLAKVYATIASASMPAGNTIYVKSGAPVSYDGAGNKVYTNPSEIQFSKEQVAGYESFDYKTYYALARDKAKEIINGNYGQYGLLDYDELWKKDNRNSREHVWSLQTVSGNVRYGITFTTGYAGIYEASGDIYNGLWYGCRDHWYKLFESKDYRIEKGVLHRWVRNFDRKWNIGSYYPDNDEYSKKAKGYTADDGTQVLPIAPYDDGLNYTCNKDAAFIAFLTKYDDRSDKTIERTDAFWPLLRYADLLLIYAEAEAEAAGLPNQEAIDALNEIRRRSNATEVLLSTFSSSIISFRSFVLEERARELALEGDRRWDLIRWGIYVDVMNSIGGSDESGVYKSRTAKHKLYPIPITEMNTNKNINENNPEW